MMLFNKNDMRLIKMLFIILGFVAGISTTGFAQDPNWDSPISGNYSNTATVISDLYFNGNLTNDPTNQIAFFVGDEIRGLSTPVITQDADYLHFVTLYSNVAIEEMTMKVYHPASNKVYETAEDLSFETGAIYGAVDSPFNINIYEDGHPPLFFNNVPDQLTLQGISFVDIEMMDYLVQIGNNEIVWSFTQNTDLDVSFDGSILKVNGAAGFSGQTSLTVRATQIEPIGLISGLLFGTSLNSTSFVETTINYTVTPMYEGPAWNHIPPQGIVKGDQFIPVDLHDYEYQYGGPAIQYDYLPILNPIKDPEPIPTWVFKKKLEVNMNVIIQMIYTPKYNFSHEDDVIAAYIDGELRGLSRRDTVSGLIFLTIGGAPTETGSVSLKFYSGQKRKTFTLDSIFDFSGYFVLGSVTQPFVIDLSPLLPIVPNLPVPGGIATVPIEIIDTSFVGIEHFKFIAFDPSYPDVLYADTATSFCISESALGFNTLYADFDGDGLGDPDISIQACNGVLNYVFNADDCDDTNTIVCSDAIIIVTYPGICEASSDSLIPPTFEDCNVTSITNDAPLFLPRGDNFVTWTVEFNYIAYKTCTQIVTVIDDESPTPVTGGLSTEWEEITSLLASDGHVDQEFGYSVDISNEWAIVGARSDNQLGPAAGAAYLMWYDGAIWTEHSKILASNGLKEDQFGSSVSISGTRVVVGALGANLDGIDKGAAYIFDYNGTSWVETAILTASNGSDDDFFGTTVSISNNFVVIGATGEDSISINSGAAYIYEYKEPWLEVGILKADDAESDDEFGYDVSISGTNAVIGARFEDSDGVNSGAAYIFEQGDIFETWTQSRKLEPNNVGANFEFGTSVDISGNHVVVGSPHNNTEGVNAGAAFIFIKNGPDWLLDQFIQADDILENDEFGTSVSISANYVAVGSPNKLSGNIDGGAVYVFRYNESTWLQESTMLASDASTGDLFGSAVAVYGHNIITGAYSKDLTSNDVGKCYLHHLNAALPLNDAPCHITLNPPVANDNCDGEIIGLLSATSTYAGFGIYEITWIYTDSSGNSSFQFQFVKTNVDTIPPMITCPSELNLFLGDDGNLDITLLDSLFYPSDNCGMVSLNFFPSTLDCTDIGLNLVIVTATDASGNETICELPLFISESPKIVKNLNDNGIGSLRQLIEGSCGGAQSIIYFDTTLIGSISLFAPPIFIDKDIEIFGLGKDVIDINGNNFIRIFEIDSMATVILRGLQLSNAEEAIDGGALLNNGILKLDNIRFIGNREGEIPKAFSNNGQIYIIAGQVEVRE
ncbi:MAG: hypothetical protein ACJATI_003114 [Halioglobus sp.]|jgi:hypothetical protein